MPDSFNQSVSLWSKRSFAGWRSGCKFSNRFCITVRGLDSVIGRVVLDTEIR